MAKKMDELLDHNYDGIQEFDNDLPGWWKGLFYLTIVFAVAYLTWYHVLGIGDSQEVQYKKSVDSTYVRLPQDQGRSLVQVVFPGYHSPLHQPGRQPDQVAVTGPVELAPAQETVVIARDSTVTPKTGAEALAEGKAIFERYCFTCHGNQGQGGIGPNLTDDYWIHGGTFPDVVHTIRAGVPVKGMISWEKTLEKDQIIEVASYVWSLHGTNPPNPKDPQGDLFARE